MPLLSKIKYPSDQTITHPGRLNFNILLAGGLIFAVSFILRIFHLDFYSLWYDEISTVTLYPPFNHTGIFRTILLERTGSEALHPLYYIILSGWIKLAGNSPWSLRLPSVFFGSCGVVVYAYIFYYLFGRKAVAFIPLLIVSPFLMWYARDARPYSLIIFLTGIHFGCFLHLLRQPNSVWGRVGFVVFGTLALYCGIFIGMLLAAEFLWLIYRRSFKLVALALVILLCAAPLLWQGYRTFFQKSSQRYRDLPAGVNLVRVAGFPQEFFLGRSFGPPTNEIRILPAKQVLRQYAPALAAEAAVLVCLIIGWGWSIKSRQRRENPPIDIVKAVGFVALAVGVQAAALIALTGYQMNARHIAFIFGPLLILAIYPVIQSRRTAPKVLFMLPLLLLWSWSSGNQLFNGSYVADDFKGAAKVLNDDKYQAGQVVALCFPEGLRYYGAEQPMKYFLESPEVTIDTIKSYMAGKAGGAWLVLNRPWAYPNFEVKAVPQRFNVMQVVNLPGVSMWLIGPEGS